MDLSTLASHGNKHPNFLHLNTLVFAAVLEVVCVSLPGYITARMGMFDAESQKFLANLNVMIFTPCLIWTKLGSQLTPDKLGELAIIPLIFLLQTFVSYMSGFVVSKMFRFNKRQKNFVTAMAVFGNSNSLPISLVISLSKTLPGLHWDKIPNDNDDEVAARGILYLLVFQQLGQMVRWSWGYHVLLAPPEKYSVQDGGSMPAQLEDGARPSHSPSSTGTSTTQALLINIDDEESDSAFDSDGANTPSANTLDVPAWNGSGTATPLNCGHYTSSSCSLGELHTHFPKPKKTAPVANPSVPEPPMSPASDILKPHTRWQAVKAYTCRKADALRSSIATSSTRAFKRLPPRLQSALSRTAAFLKRFSLGLWEFMNPPLWAMLCAIVVACVPTLRHLFFTRGTFLNTSVTRAIEQSGGVAVPLILVVLGANLARNTIPKSQLNTEDPKIEKWLLVACLVSRMLLPTLIMAPFLASLAKFAPVSIVDDPVFVVVCFLLTGAPSALQLAQICQLNNVYVGVMTNLLFQSYVIWYVTLLSFQGLG